MPVIARSNKVAINLVDSEFKESPIGSTEGFNEADGGKAALP